jgi:hypothetical protein
MPTAARTPGRSSPRRVATAAALCAAVLALTITGCTAAMTADTPAAAPNRPYTGTVADWPMFFKRHMFGAVCFDTQGCSILYDRREHGTERVAPPKSSLRPERYDAVMIGTYGDLPNFPPPAQLRWRAKDGTELSAEADFDEIFRDRLIRHKVPREEIPEDVSMGFTHVVLEIDDRTVNVYTRTLIPTRSEQIPGNRYSTGRSDLIQVYSRSY